MIRSNIIKPGVDPSGRLGHQFFNILPAIILAEITNSHFNASFLGVCTHWNNIFSFQRLKNFSEIDKKYNTVSLQKFDPFDIKKLKTLLDNFIFLPPQKIYELQLNQDPGKLLALVPSFHDEIKKCLKIRIPNSQDVVVHMRRGDVTLDYANSLYLDDKFYLKIITTLINQGEKVTVFSQGERIRFNFLDKLIETGKVKLELTESLIIDNRDIDTFIRFLGAKTFIGSYSCFSILAMILRDQSKRSIFLEDERSLSSHHFIEMRRMLRLIGVSFLKYDFA
ncbi:hypothetical protein Syncc9902_0089 [Synechococcus sp. CC9902]|uniref:hypothetical protein n=1 Tax=Synechococcus sp. (strain CC9902) TaxID=316279 RepID=UPI00005D3CF2|nr:hypothetical protein [Synechococcus sp. CC9902]ABB25064.1 hypothetical protein Syncc9902_0089 [Synechococcus sp. CC9902]